jgi:hypothetical protein
MLSYLYSSLPSSLIRIAIQSHCHSSLPTTVTPAYRLPTYPIITSPIPMLLRVQYYAKFPVCKGTSVRFLTSPILSHSPPVHIYSLHSPCIISKDRTYSRRPPSLTVRRLPRSRLTDSRRLPTSPPARTSTASDGLRTHWDRSV